VTSSILIGHLFNLQNRLNHSTHSRLNKLMITTEFASQIIGIIGAITLLYAYAMISKGKLTNTSPVYHIYNLTGAFLVSINASHMEALGALILNVAWMIIALWHLIKNRQKKGV